MQTSARRKVWLVYLDSIREVLTGPGIRTMELSSRLAAEGHEVHLVCVRCDRSLPEGMTWHPYRPEVVDEFCRGDAVIVSSEVSGRFVWKLCRSDIPFHLDSYNITATEVLELGAEMTPRQLNLNLLRRAMRYGTLWCRCEVGYLSAPVQAAILGGMFLHRRHPKWAKLAARIPQKCLVAPMGIPSRPIPDAENPYPEALRGRQILLWGGGIWSWFDIEGLLHSMSMLRQRGSTAVLWFLASENPSGISIHDAPFRKAKELASELGLLGSSVFFNSTKITPDMLPGYLAHCTAGIMANPASLEAWCSWRTRLLDLMWAGKPLFTMGFDPLSEKMARDGAASLSQAGDLTGFVSSLTRVLNDPSSLHSMGIASKSCGEAMTWDRNLEPILRRVSDPGAFADVGDPPQWSELIRYIAGV